MLACKRAAASGWIRRGGGLEALGFFEGGGLKLGTVLRLQEETSGVMVAAKTKNGFPEIRMLCSQPLLLLTCVGCLCVHCGHTSCSSMSSRQFKSEHSLEEGGTEKSYFALVRGQVPFARGWLQLSGDFWRHSCPEVQVPVKPMRPNEARLILPGLSVSSPTPALPGASEPRLSRPLNFVQDWKHEPHESSEHGRLFLGPRMAECS